MPDIKLPDGKKIPFSNTIDAVVPFVNPIFVRIDASLSISLFSSSYDKVGPSGIMIALSDCVEFSVIFANVNNLSPQE